MASRYKSVTSEAQGLLKHASRVGPWLELEPCLFGLAASGCDVWLSRILLHGRVSRLRSGSTNPLWGVMVSDSFFLVCTGTQFLRPGVTRCTMSDNF